MASASAPIDPSLRIASVELAVADLARSVDFYERAMGMSVISRDEGRASLGADGQRASLQIAQLERPAPPAPHASGLFHVAWLHPGRPQLAATVRRLAASSWPIDGASDHGVSEALYVSDPDGLGIEIYADRPREEWPRPADGRGVEMVTLPLDIEDLLAQGPSEPQPALASGTHIGHVHLKVADVARANAYYRDALGFEEQARLPGAAFLSAGGYHHHIGLNSWQSRGGQPAPADSPGLRRVTFELADGAAVRALEDRLRAAGAGAEPNGARGLSVRDPDGELLRFVAA